MSDVASRPAAARGRGSGRGGRGGFAGRGSRRANGEKADYKSGDAAAAAVEDDGDFAELRKQYGSKTSVIREMFPDWSEVDVLFALQETNGDENEAVTRIADGTISQWGEVSKAKKTSRTKTKDATATTTNNESSSGARAARGGRAVSEGTRGRGKAAAERGGRGGRARSSQATGANGTRNKENHQLSVPTEESSAWGDAKPQVQAVEDKSIAADKPTLSDASKPAAPQAKTWASMLRQSTVPKPAAKPKETQAHLPTPAEPTEPSLAEEPSHAASRPAELHEETTPVAELATPDKAPQIVEPEVALAPSKDDLTETNLEQVVDDSQPAPTGTAASTAADSWDPRQNQASATVTPLSAAQQQHQGQRGIPSGYAASAIKATAGRVPSYQRRVLDQEEAVRMPGNREVDRAAVQFGAFSLTGADEDIDGDREEAETRAQPPAESPVAHPRTSLPPTAQPASVPEAFAQTPAYNAASAGPPGGAPGLTQGAHAPAANQQYGGRFGQTAAQDVSGAPQKPMDLFNQNAASQQPGLDNFPSQSTQQPSQQPGSAFSSAPSEYSSYYTANQQDRNAYNSYYAQQYGQQPGAHGPAEAASSQQRPFAGFNSLQNDNLSQYPQSGSLHNQPRLGGSGSEAQNSGHSTPNPTTQAQQQQGGPGSQQPQSHGQQYPGYNSHHPYYSNPYYHQYYSGYGQGGGFGPYGKGGAMYGQQPYGMSPNAPYEHASSPGTFGQSSLQRDSGMSSALGDYGRGGSGQVGNQAGLGGSSFGNAHDSFARGASSFQNQGQSFNGQNQPGNAAMSNDDLKPFGESKAGPGPSPSLGGVRPGSATNTVPTSQSGLPPPQTSQIGAGYGGYPSHLQGQGMHGSNAYGMGGGGAGSQQGNTPYGSYGQGQGQGFGSGGYYGGGQQQQQQQQQQQRSGWGGNYH